ncbi:hypothetical protein L1F30_11885 [Simiduia sp. 21SJ11W-1]|uniref:SIR2 family NAD-dependent protein deacylase n=1 Tax=Simiduia sp. 21SJ11W-1 TaxID=2909669 RepID=UPI0020A1A956|nr:Sir2 family NAD-dependent protein deacetylase [Simiduia sp. 21SJ11W-1]UTA46861.1 hypothetical protein L1F30_11885 [Simiduia sp. 21SJ11W-1]
MSKADQALINRAAALIAAADGLLVTGGAGMGVDSGLPDFRGNEGFWRAYPALAASGVRFEAIANPAQFSQSPALAWGFYGHRLNLYRRTQPHGGFGLLRAWGERCPKGYFVFTSNVDGHYQRAGFDPARVVECHGSINHLQCVDCCELDIWPAPEAGLQIDEARCLAAPPLPKCPHCGGLARPNILMFGDSHWNSVRASHQKRQLERWLADVERLVIVECGAGTAIPSVRRQGDSRRGQLIRINPREPQSEKPGAVCLPMGALEALQAIDAALAAHS